MTSQAPKPARPSGLRRPWARTAALAGAFGICLAVCVWAGPLAVGRISTPGPQGYYAYLTDALLSGQLHLKLQPDPALKRLPNPWAGNQGIRRLHDATYYNDRYYLYFSFVPALLICAPWHLVTGEFLTDGGTTFISVSLGLLLSALFLRQACRRWFPNLGPAWLAAGLLLFGLGNTMLWLVTTQDVYPVPTSTAVTFALLALLALNRALAHERWRARFIALGAASLAWGLAVGCRPQYLPTLGGLAIGLAYLAAVAAREQGWFSRRVVAVLLAGVLPAALVGFALAAYNYARFASILEFGTSYMFAAGDQRNMEMFSLRNFPANLHTYLFQSATFSPYFPYLVLREGGLGTLPGTPLALLGLLWPLTLLHAPLRRNPAWIITGLALLGCFLCNLFLITLLPSVHVRYRSDWMPYGLLAGLLTLYALLDWVRQTHAPRLLRRLVRVFLTGLFAWTAAHVLLLAFVYNPRPDKTRALVQGFNQFTAGIQHLRGVQFGPVSCKVSFPAGQPEQREALLVAGDGKDLLYIEYLDGNQIRIGFHHVGDGGPVSDPVTVEPGRTYDLDLNLGCFYPPLEHPLFAGWPERRVRMLQRQLVVTLDGKDLLRGGSDFYPTHPGDIHFGRNSGPYPPEQGFTGTIGPLHHHGLPALATSSASGKIGPMRLTVRFPTFQSFRSEPLISTGSKNAGDLFYVTYLGPELLRFGHDVWGGGAIETPSLPYSPDQPQTIELELPETEATSGIQTGRLIVRYNGTTVIADDRPVHAGSAADVFLGFNGSDSSAARMNFSGRFERVEPIAALSLATDQFQTASGPARLILKFPADFAGHTEPLLCTGRAGAADLIYVRYEDANHIRIGYDHWSVGGPLSPPIPVDYSATHELEISHGALFPGPEDPAWGRVDGATRTRALETVTVRLNGRTVLTHAQKAYRSEAGDILVGLNSVGASTSERLFTGRVFVRERLGLSAFSE